MTLSKCRAAEFFQVLVRNGLWHQLRH